jgi:hypothetical protein
MNKIYGQVVALTKNIYLKSQSGCPYGTDQFFVGKRDPFIFSGGIGITWWYKPMTFKIIENIAFMITSKVIEFIECDHETIKNCIRNTLHEICVEPKIFDADAVCFGTKDTLFECRVENDVRRFGKHIVDAILSNIRYSISKSCVIYSVPKITGKSFHVITENISLLNKDDLSEWDNLSNLGYAVHEWLPKSGNFRDGSKTALSNLKYDYLFVVKTKGTANGNKFYASLKIRKLSAVIFSLIAYKRRVKVRADPHTFCIHIPHLSAQNRSITLNEIGALFPYYGEEIVIDESDISNINKWYEEEGLLDKDKKNRVGKSAYYINKGMNSKDIDSYIYYFVALDALFGKVGSVSQSIKDAVNCLPNADSWNEKIKWLFDLRNELVHGGSRYIEEWPKYMNYYRHFSSEPAHDIEKLALHALASAPKIFKSC